MYILQVSLSPLQCLRFRTERCRLLSKLTPLRSISSSEFAHQQSIDVCLEQADAAQIARESASWGPSTGGSALEFGAAPAELQRATEAKRAKLLERETALQRWALALELESARQAAASRTLKEQTETVCSCYTINPGAFIDPFHAARNESI